MISRIGDFAMLILKKYAYCGLAMLILKTIALNSISTYYIVVITVQL